MRFDIEGDIFPIVRVKLDESDAIKVVTSNVLGHSSNIRFGTGVVGKMLSNIIKMIVGGSVLYQVATNNSNTSGEVILGGNALGDTTVVQLGKSGLRVVKECFIACDDSVIIDKSIKSIIKNKVGNYGVKGLTLSGEGNVVLCGCGSVHRKNISKEDYYLMDSGCVIAYSPNLKVSFHKSDRGVFSLFKKSEKIMMKFSGQGTVLYSSCSKDLFGTTLKEMGFGTVKDMVMEESQPVEDEFEKLSQERKDYILLQLNESKSLDEAEQSRVESNLRKKGYSQNLIDYIKEVI